MFPYMKVPTLGIIDFKALSQSLLVEYFENSLNLFKKNPYFHQFIIENLYGFRKVYINFSD